MFFLVDSTFWSWENKTWFSWWRRSAFFLSFSFSSIMHWFCIYNFKFFITIFLFNITYKTLVLFLGFFVPVTLFLLHSTKYKSICYKEHGCISSTYFMHIITTNEIYEHDIFIYVANLCRQLKSTFDFLVCSWWGVRYEGWYRFPLEVLRHIFDSPLNSKVCVRRELRIWIKWRNEKTSSYIYRPIRQRLLHWVYVCVCKG